MSLSGNCEICGLPSVEFSCDRCGSLVCDDHFEADVGLCTECRAEVGGTGGVPAGEDPPDDVDTYRF
ncbi:hypothetical protein BRC73_03420 [Halobacteriales archaeon QH_7_66_37]|nr:MAG: hypothetical protein BRC73_03420 [Halobacteriales archaeon QH_7_66_37]